MQALLNGPYRRPARTTDGFAAVPRCWLNMKASVIIPTYNRRDQLICAIKSVLGQTVPANEIIVVDDGSTDDTAGAIRKLAREDIRYLRHNTNRGPGAARNIGIREARGELISFLDSDDLWKPDKLRSGMAFLAAHPEADGVFTDVELYRGLEFTPSVAGTHAPFRRLIAGRSSPEGNVFGKREMYLCLLEDMPAKIQAVTLRRSSLADMDLFREDFAAGEDWEFLLRFSRSHVWGYIARPLVTQQVMPDSTLGRHSTEDARLLMGRFIEEKRSLKGDPEGMRAVSRGIAHHGRRLGWLYLHAGHGWQAASAYFRTSVEARDPGSIIRIFGIVLPTPLRKHVSRLARRASFLV